MKKFFYIFSMIILMMSFSKTAHAQDINWMTVAEALEKSEQDENPKKMFIDVYADWCGWCKKMDSAVFTNPEVSAYMQANFYMVKLNAESKEDIVFRGHTFKFVPNGRRGYHEFAAALLENKFSYPTVVYLDENKNMLQRLPGYYGPDQFLKAAKYFGDDIFKVTPWAEYESNPTEHEKSTVDIEIEASKYNIEMIENQDAASPTPVENAAPPTPVE